MKTEINEVPRAERDPDLLRHMAFGIEDALETASEKGVTINRTQARTIRRALFSLADRIDLD